jgi:hypothetical protein
MDYCYASMNKTGTEALTPLRRQLEMARTELNELYELADQGVVCWNRIKDVERQVEKLERISR